jgi:serine/threonine-protein kinase
MRKIDRYQIFAEIQRGPITTVYKAYQEDLERVVLLKVLNEEWASDQDLVDRFRREGQASARVRHPNVVSVFDFGFADGVPYLVTEFVEGTTLAELISRIDALPVELAIYITREVAAGLSAVHEKGIVHRDIKPANIFLSEGGEVRLGDFGLAVEGAESGDAVAGTPAYLAPEAVAGGSVGPAADLFALGVTLYEMLTGDNPFADRTASRTLHHVVNMIPPPLRRLRPEIPVKLEELCDRLLAKEPAYRPDSPQTVADDLAALERRHGISVGEKELLQFLNDPDSYQPVEWPKLAEGASQPSTSGEVLDRSMRRPPEVVKAEGAASKRRPRVLWPMIAAAAAVVLLGGTAVMVRQGGPSPQKRETQQAGLDSASVLATAEDLAQPSRQTPTEEEPTSTAPTESERLSAQPEKASEEKIDTTPAAMKASEPGGWLRVTSDPRAIVFLDQDSIGVTPFENFIDVASGDRQLCLRSPGWPEVCKTVTVAPEETLNVHISLWQEVGYLVVEVAPWGEIWIDGAYVDTTPLQRPLVIAPGDHVLEVRHPTLGGRFERITAAAGDTLRRQYRLQPARP